MAETSSENETIQTLEEISGVVDESEIRAVFSTQCIKVKTALIYKLGKKVNNKKETCHIINDANMKLKFEISHSQKVLQYMLKAQQTVRMANIELDKESLVTKHKKMVVTERVTLGKQKYEQLWSDSKAQYESVPFIQKYLQAKEHVKNLQHKIAELDNKKNVLSEEIKAKTISCLNLDRKRVIEFADYMINKMPKSIEVIREKSATIKKMKDDMEKIEKQKQTDAVKINEAEKLIIQNETQEKMDEDDWLPKLNLDLDFEEAFKVKIDKVNKTLDGLDKNSKEMKLKTYSDTMIKNVDEDDYSPYFTKPSIFIKENKTQNYAMRKLVNIIEDVKIDSSSAQIIMNKVNPENLYPVDVISVNDKKKVQSNKPVESEMAEDIIDKALDTENLLIPPTQFMDMTLTVLVHDEKEKEEELATASQPKDTPNSTQTLKAGFIRKKVSFELPKKLVKEVNEIDEEMPEKLEKADNNDTIDSQMNVSAASDDGIGKIKDMLMKLHNLDLSPQFVYAKNVMTTINSQKTDEGVITSKFFYHEPVQTDTMKKTVDDNVEENTTKINEKMQISDADKDTRNIYNVDKEFAVSNPPTQNTNEILQPIQMISGHNMQSHGTQLIYGTLEGSMISNMDYEDGDTNFAHCLDSSLLLSPKADYSIPETCEKPEKLSAQEAPNFLSGLRKTGLGFFASSPVEANTDSNAQNQQSGFSFNFGGEEKKTRGGLFNMFQ